MKRMATLLFLTHTLAAQEAPIIINPIAGSGEFCVKPTDPCGDGGPVIHAKFNSPRGLTSLLDGGYLIADRFTNRIRGVAAVKPDAIIDTIAGTGEPCRPSTAACGDGGPARKARLTIPRATSLTSDRGYLIADEGDHRIRKVSKVAPDGVIDTVAGTGRMCPKPTDPCGDGGPATKALLHAPHDVVAVPGGSEFIIVDTYDHRIRRVSNGVIRTIAGTGVPCAKPVGGCGDGGPAKDARLHYPHGLVLLPEGGFLFADASDHLVRKVSKDGIITSVAGDGRLCSDHTAPCGDHGPATKARLGTPRGLALTKDGGFLFSDTTTNRVRLVSSDGIITTVAGNGLLCKSAKENCGNGGPAVKAKLDGPQDVMLTADGFLIADAGASDDKTDKGDNRIRIVSGARKP